MTDAALADLDSLDKETLKALLNRERSSSLQQIEHLKLVIEKLRRMLFGVKSEKLAGELARRTILAAARGLVRHRRVCPIADRVPKQAQENDGFRQSGTREFLSPRSRAFGQRQHSKP